MNTMSCNENNIYLPYRIAVLRGNIMYKEWGDLDKVCQLKGQTSG